METIDIDVILDGTVLFQLGYRASNYANLPAAIAAIGTTPGTLYIDSAQAVTDDLIIPETLSVVVFKPGLLTISSGKILTINGSFQAGLFQVLDGLGTAIFGNGSVKEVYPQWWGGNGLGLVDQTTYIEKALDSGPHVHITSGIWLCNISIADVLNKTISGDGDNTILKTADDLSPVITIESTSVQVIGIRINNLKIDGNNTSYGIYMTASTPYVVTQSRVENIFFEKCTQSIRIESGTDAEECYLNYFNNIRIANIPDAVDPARNYGIYINKGVYNIFSNVNITGVGDYCYALFNYATNNSFLDVVTDGVIRNGGQNASFYNTTIETIACTTPPTEVDEVFRNDGYNSTIIGLTIVNCDSAKCLYGLNVWNPNHFITKVRVYGALQPDYAVIINDGSSGILSNVEGGLYTSFQSVSEFIRSQWFIRNAGEIGRTEIFANASPVSGYYDQGDKAWNSEPAASGTPGWVCVKRIDTAIRIQAVATNVIIEVDATTGMIAGDIVGITLDNGVIHWTDIDTVNDGDTMTITAGIPSGRTAEIDAIVYTNRWKAMANLSA